MNNDLISRSELKKKIEEVQYTQEFCIEHQIDYSISMQMLGMIIDNAPTVDYPSYQEAYQTGYEEAKKGLESPIVQISMKDLTAEEKQHFFNVFKNWKNVPLQVIEERPQGRWIKTQEDRWIYPICSECGYKENVVTNYCGNCGAKMDKEDK